MRLAIWRSVLLRSLAHAQGIVERHTISPILANILLETRSNDLSLRATNTDIEIAEVIPCETSQQGCATVSAHTLYDIVRRLPDTVQIVIEYSDDKKQLSLQTGRSRFTLTCLPVEDFPVMSRIGDDPVSSFNLKVSDLRNLLERTRFAMSTEETRYYLNGLYLHATNSNNVDVLRAVATDGHRLAYMEIPMPLGGAGMPDVIIPRKAVEELRGLVDNTENVTIMLSRNRICFVINNITLTSKLIDGTFPDYERVIPTSNDKIMEVDTKLFADAVGRVSAVIATDKTRAIRLDVSQGGIVLSASNSTTADNAVDELDVSYSCAPLSIGFNGRYLLDILGQMTGNTVQFSLLDSSSPTIVREITNDSVLYVLMPMRV